MVQEIPLNLNLALLSGLLIFLDAIVAVTFFPIIFNCFFIPQIERKTGKKLVFPEYLRYIVFGYFLYRYIFIARYIIRRYWFFKFKKEKEIPLSAKDTILGRVNYTIDMFSNFEIFMSFLVFVNMFMGVLFLIIFFIASGKADTFLANFVSKFS